MNWLFRLVRSKKYARPYVQLMCSTCLKTYSEADDAWEERPNYAHDFTIGDSPEELMELALAHVNESPRCKKALGSESEDFIACRESGFRLKRVKA